MNAIINSINNAVVDAHDQVKGEIALEQELRDRFKTDDAVIAALAINPSRKHFINDLGLPSVSWVDVKTGNTLKATNVEYAGILERDYKVLAKDANYKTVLEADEHRALLDKCDTPAGQSALFAAVGKDAAKFRELLATRGLAPGVMKATGRNAPAHTEEVKGRADPYASTNVYLWPEGQRRSDAILKLVGRQAALAGRLARAANCRIDGKPLG